VLNADILICAVTISLFSGLANALVSRLLHNAISDLLEMKFQSFGFLTYFLGAPKSHRPGVAEMSLFLLLALVNQEWKRAKNPFREALATLRNKPHDQPLSLSQSACAPFEQIYEVLSR